MSQTSIPEDSRNPFAIPSENPGEYRYFDLEKITEPFRFYRKDLWEARKLIENGTVTLDRVYTGYENRLGNNGTVGVAYGSYRTKSSEGQISMIFRRDRLLRTQCTVRRCNHFLMEWQIESEAEGLALCIHEMALLLLLRDYLQKYNPGDATDRNASQVLEHLHRKFSLQRDAERAQEAQPLLLEPVLNPDPAGLKLGFKVGFQRMYVVKNMTDLVQHIEDREPMMFGKTQINFLEHTLSEESLPYYNFIRAQVSAELRRAQIFEEQPGYYGNYNFKVTKEIDLFGDALDSFYEIAEGKRIPYSDKKTKEKGELLLQEGDPQVVLSLTASQDEDGVCHGLQVTGETPRLFRGFRYSYFIENRALNRIRPEFAEQLVPLLAGRDTRQISFQIGRRHLSEFYHNYLPALSEYFTVEDHASEVIEPLLPPQPKFIFYLDEAEGYVVCRIGAVYGQKEWELAFWEDRNPSQGAMFRDHCREEEAILCVCRYLPKADPQNRVFWAESDEDLIYRILEDGIAEMEQLGEVRSTDSFRNLKIRRKFSVSVGVRVESDLMNLEISSDDLSREELMEVLYGYDRKKKYYRLRSGDFIAIEDDSLAELAAMIETMHISPKDFAKGKMEVPIYRALYLDKMLEESEGLYTNRDRRFKQMVKDFKTVGDSDYEVPASLRTVMRGYQEFGYKWLRTLEHCGFGGVLADEMGLGKTLQMIAVLLAAKEEGESGPSLVVTPASLVYNWQEEFARFAPQLSVTTIAGGQKERRERIHEAGKWDVLITSYDLLKRDIAEYEDISFRYQVIDEAQYIKNHGTAAAKSVKVIHSRARFALTGTPIENRLSELWSIFDYLMPGFLYGYETFRKELETPIVRHGDEEAMRRLKRMVGPFILRRLKSDVLRDLPEKIEEVRYAKMARKQQRLYDAQVVHMRNLLAAESEESFRKDKLKVLAELTRIRQICCDPSLLFSDYDGESAKREACMDLIRSAIEGEHKMLVFSQFTSMLELLEQDLCREGISYYKITGSTGKQERLWMVQKFNEDEVPVFLISLKAGGVGLNLTGADVVIHYDPWWNLAVQNQATDRAHRIGQTKIVSVYRLIVKGSIEEKILKMQETKKDLAEEILSGETRGIVSMSREDLLELIENSAVEK